MNIHYHSITCDNEWHSYYQVNAVSELIILIEINCALHIKICIKCSNDNVYENTIKEIMKKHTNLKITNYHKIINHGFIINDNIFKEYACLCVSKYGNNVCNFVRLISSLKHPKTINDNTMIKTIIHGTFLYFSF